MRGNSAADGNLDAAWRRELAYRLAAYRSRRRRLAPREGQPELPFERPEPVCVPAAAVAVDDASSESADEEFAFTIAIGRHANSAPAPHEAGRMEIDVSEPPVAECAERSSEDIGELPAARSNLPSLFPVAPLWERRIAALIDVAFLLFAYGGFLALFGSLGGQFTLSKLSAAVYAATLALFYVQYFALFTVFGGTTPGMMLRNLHVMTFTGEPPRSKQLLLRSLGYVASAGSFFLGFAWAFWDEDHLTWHDRVSRTYLTCGAGVSQARIMQH